MVVEALILSKIMSTLPLHPVSLNAKWKHLDSLQLADPEFGTPGNVELLLGADIFSHVVFHGQQCGPSNSPSVFKAQFGWVLAGAVHAGPTPQVLHVYHRRRFESGRHVEEILGVRG